MTTAIKLNPRPIQELTHYIRCLNCRTIILLGKILPDYVRCISCKEEYTVNSIQIGEAEAKYNSEPWFCIHCNTIMKYQETCSNCGSSTSKLNTDAKKITITIETQ